MNLEYSNPMYVETHGGQLWYKIKPGYARNHVVCLCAVVEGYDYARKLATAAVSYHLRQALGAPIKETR
jgi:hypothetical protein